MTQISSVQGLFHLFPVPDLFRGRNEKHKHGGVGRRQSITILGKNAYETS